MLAAPSLAATPSCAELPDGCPPVALTAAPTAPAADVPQRPSHWYGEQTLLADGVSVGVVAIALGARSAEAAIAAGVLYAAGGPVVHLGHGRPWMMVASFATRVTAPAIGAGTGALVMMPAPGDSNGGNFLVTIGAGIGAATGALASVILDAAVYSNEKAATPSRWDGKPLVEPRASITPSGASFGVGGAF